MHSYFKAEKSQQTALVENHQAAERTLFPDHRPAAIQMRKLQQTADRFTSGRNLQTDRQGLTTNNTGLPDGLKPGIEQLSGYSMNDVKVHYNSSKPRQLKAHACAKGNHIHLAPGQERNLPHEAWHVVQQKQGRVRPTLQMKKGVMINDDISLEREADVMGEKALQMRPYTQGKSFKSPSSFNQTIQRVTDGALRASVTQYREIREAVLAGLEDGHTGAVNELLARLEAHVAMVSDDPEYETKGQAYTGLYKFVDGLYDRLHNLETPHVREVEARLSEMQAQLRAATTAVAYPAEHAAEAAGGGGGGGGAAAGAEAEPLAAPVGALHVPPFGRGGVSAQAAYNVHLAERVVTETSALHDSGPWSRDNRARYYMHSATKPEAGGDAEVKVLSEVTARISELIGYGRGGVIRGTVVLQTNLGPCPSCRAVIKTFHTEHPGVRLIIRYPQEEAQIRNEGNAKVRGMLGFSDAHKEGHLWVKVFEPTA